MLTKYEFEMIRNIYEGIATSDDLTSLKEKGLIDKQNQITSLGMSALNEHKVDNAIILSAGMSTRFVPVSFEKPKGLIAVKGEPLIERIIRQLQEKGISEIVVVVGYMMDKFLYLREKFGVTLVVNNEFSTKNTHSSIYHVKDYLRNTYICCSDNYYPENPFHKYEYRAFYCSIYLKGVSYVERAFTFDKDGLIFDTNKPSNNQWIMYGHAYFDKTFTQSFIPILNSYYGKDGIENYYWETVYAENVDKLPMYIKQCQEGEILEFDSMEELKAFDPDYIAHNHIKIFENICKVLKCDISDIKDIEVIKKGLNNRSFKFLVNNEYYVYRHPGNTAFGVVDRKKEAASLNIAKKLKIDDTLVYIDNTEGWKISKFVSVKDTFEFKNIQHINLLAESLKKLHAANVKVGFLFDYSKEAKKLLEIIKVADNNAYEKLVLIEEKMTPIIQLLKNDPWQISLCHNDIYEPNLLLADDRLELIDWEFAGDTDIGFDICKLFSLSRPNFYEADKWLYTYFGRKTTKDEKLHLFSCAAVIYYYWFVWSIYESKIAGKASTYMMDWYDKMSYYADIVLNEFNN